MAAGRQIEGHGTNMEERTQEIAIEYLEHYKKVKYGMMPEWVWDMAIKTLEQEPKTGHWILDETDNSITCDKCGCLIWSNDISNGEANFCPNCGAKMVVPQESENKDTR